MFGVLALLFLVVPFAELWVILRVADLIGGWETIGLLILMSVLGSWLVKREGWAAWRRITSRVQTGEVPGDELVDGGLILFAGALLLTPGFVTDVAGFFLILPFTRPLARRALQGYLTRRAVQATVRRTPPGAQRPGAFGGTVVPGEVIDPHPDDPPRR